MMSGGGAVPSLGAKRRAFLAGAAVALSAAVPRRAVRAQQDAPAEQVVVIDTGQRVWRVPYGYLSIRPPAHAIQPMNHWRRFSFAFWMPDGRPTRVAGHELAWLRPHEPGRPPPGPDEFVFIATHVEAWDAGGLPQPAQMFANALSIPGTDRHDFRERWGMVEATPKPGEGELWDKYLLSRFHRGDPPGATEAYARCSRPHPTDNGICSGQASLLELKVAFHVRLPKDRMDRFVDALDIARQLLLGWAGENPANK